MSRQVRTRTVILASLLAMHAGAAGATTVPAPVPPPRPVVSEAVDAVPQPLRRPGAEAARIGVPEPAAVPTAPGADSTDARSEPTGPVAVRPVPAPGRAAAKAAAGGAPSARGRPETRTDAAADSRERQAADVAAEVAAKIAAGVAAEQAAALAANAGATGPANARPNAGADPAAGTIPTDPARAVFPTRESVDPTAPAIAASPNGAVPGRRSSTVAPDVTGPVSRGANRAQGPARSPLPPTRVAAAAPVAVPRAVPGRPAAPAKAAVPAPDPAADLAADPSEIRFRWETDAPEQAERTAAAAQTAGNAAPDRLDAVPVRRPEAPAFRNAALPEPGARGPAPAGRAICGDSRLRGTVAARIAGPISGCGIAAPVKITQIAGITLTTPATLECRTARTFADWVTGSADPAAKRQLGSGISKIWVMGTYACRTRNNRRGARLSEHALGRAVDIGGFWLHSGRKITVQTNWGKGSAGAFLRDVWKRACGPFKTVLGPRADRWHHDHLHLDTSRRKGGTYCR